MQEETARKLEEREQQNEHLHEVRDDLNRMLRRATPNRKVSQQLKRRRKVLSMVDEISRRAA